MLFRAHIIDVDVYHLEENNIGYHFQVIQIHFQGCDQDLIRQLSVHLLRLLI